VHNDFKNSHNCRVVIIDSLQCSMAYGIPVIAAARMAQKGRTSEDITVQINHILQNLSAFFAVPDLKYLRKGKKSAG